MKKKNRLQNWTTYQYGLKIAKIVENIFFCVRFLYYVVYDSGKTQNFNKM